jgi:hypothetical protein
MNQNNGFRSQVTESGQGVENGVAVKRITSGIENHCDGLREKVCEFESDEPEYRRPMVAIGPNSQQSQRRHQRSTQINRGLSNPTPIKYTSTQDHSESGLQIIGSAVSYNENNKKNGM